MAVAVKNSPINLLGSARTTLAAVSLIGALIVLGSLAVVFYGVPWFWAWLVGDAIPNTFVYNPLKWVLMAVLGAALGFLEAKLAGPRPIHGMRAGITVAICGLFATVGLAVAIGLTIAERGWVDPANTGVGLTVLGIIAAALLGLVVMLLQSPRGHRLLTALEDQGLFQASAYKRTQGLRVRRLTILGLLIVAAFGCWNLYSSNTLVTASRDWVMSIPFTDVRFVVLPDIRYTIPILVFALALWMSYRAVNMPMFADFLIATEAEINKVSWTSRRRLFQDTAVVLTTVALFTLFLFGIDQFWGFVLSNRFIGVLPPTGTPVVRSETDGEVREAEKDHITVEGHAPYQLTPNQNLRVKAGDKVTKGQILADVEKANQPEKVDY